MGRDSGRLVRSPGLTGVDGIGPVEHDVPALGNPLSGSGIEGGGAKADIIVGDRNVAVGRSAGGRDGVLAPQQVVSRHGHVRHDAAANAGAEPDRIVGAGDGAGGACPVDEIVGDGDWSGCRADPDRVGVSAGLIAATGEVIPRHHARIDVDRMRRRVDERIAFDGNRALRGHECDQRCRSRRAGEGAILDRCAVGSLRLVNRVRTRTGCKRAVFDRNVLGRDVEGRRTEIDSAQNSAVLGDTNAIVNRIIEVGRMPICGQRQV